MELYIARHGETEANAQRRWQGQGMDTPLTPKGISQAKALGESLEGIEFDAIYSSPLNRAMDTTRIVFKDQNLFEGRGVADKRLAEIALGDAEGSVYSDGEDAEFPQIFHELFYDTEDYTPPRNGETLPDMLKRVDSFLEEIAKKPYKKVFALAHGYVLRVVYACALDKSVAAISKAPRFGNCALCRYVYCNGKWEFQEVIEP